MTREILEKANKVAIEIDTLKKSYDALNSKEPKPVFAKISESLDCIFNKSDRMDGAEKILTALELAITKLWDEKEEELKNI